MIVYVETNFLLELAYLQERCVSCAEILQMAKTGQIALALPAFSAAEARATWHRRASERREFHSALQTHIREISRSEPFRSLRDQSRDVVAALVAGAEESQERLETAIQAVETDGTLIPLSGEIVKIARVYELYLSLSPQDALVLESVRSHAEKATGAKCFITQDVKGFANPSVYDELSAVDCKVLVNFDDAVAYIRNASDRRHS
ncbi:MAG TPA: PIN domain-containing protein [Thermoanaerobaculia bacterium]|nr:PIN domain-containing protein [Thermoanaerobaculia bacterium]